MCLKHGAASLTALLGMNLENGKEKFQHPGLEEGVIWPQVDLAQAPKRFQKAPPRFGDAHAFCTGQFDGLRELAPQLRGGVCLGCFRFRVPIFRALSSIKNPQKSLENPLKNNYPGKRPQTVCVSVHQEKRR